MDMKRSTRETLNYYPFYYHLLIYSFSDYWVFRVYKNNITEFLKISRQGESMVGSNNLL